MEQADWQVAEALAQDWVKQRTDYSEVRRLMNYLRQLMQQEHPTPGDRFFEFVQVLATDGAVMQRSQQTTVYYRELWVGCDRYLQAYRAEPQKLLEILGWTTRLMRYYSAR
jgi:hypothetical protein